MENNVGLLYIVPTPIGNLEDITLRALNILRSVDLIACEDTRHTLKLLNHYGIQAQRISYHEHNERQRTGEILEKIERGAKVALVSDAGMPVISDPGDILVKAALEASISVVVLPGANAALTALVGSGLPAKKFSFQGFMPRKSTEIKEVLQRAMGLADTTIFYESPKRLLRTLEEIQILNPDWKIAVARELTKLHEEIHRGSVTEILDYFSEFGVRGEIVLLLEGGASKPPSQQDAIEAMERLMEEGLSHSQAVKQVAKELGMKRNELYGLSIPGRSNS
ncbi:MAG: 16S rRNA (cytidine(1402)-2'-O)-methyltransferase [Tissierellia bacterium]|nr:16S rRNA (cytidine(1402)-2'-O)-methyltransferase [Tissierellia bacterium]